jgi:hypothetical protein
MLGRVRRKKRVLPFVLLAVLVAVNAYVIALLLRPEPQIAAEPVARNTPTTPMPSTTSTDLEPSPSRTAPSPSPESSSKGEPEVIPTKSLLFAESARAAWRASVGDCQTSGTVERSTDGGKTWRSVVKTGLAPVVRLGVGAGNVYTVGGAGQACSTRYTEYATDGSVVASTDNPSNMWFPRPKNRDEIHGPANNKATPCAPNHVVGMSSLTVSDALVICTDGSSMVTSDSGQSWEEAAELPGTMAVGSGGGRYWIAGTTAECDGISVRSLAFSEGELSPSPSQCAPTPEVIGGEVAIDVSDNTVWLWAGQKVQTSSDGGESWI